MRLFSPELYRSFAIGFALGSAVLAVSLVARSETGIAGQVFPAAEAAPTHPDMTLAAPAR